MLNIKHIKAGKVTLTAITLLNLTIPGILGLFLLENSLFMQMDFWKVLLVAIALSATFLLLSFMISLIFFEGLLTVPVQIASESSNKKKKKVGFEDNDLALVLLTNVFCLVTWGVCSLFLWINNPLVGSKAIAREIVLSYTWCLLSFLVVFFVLVALKKRKKNSLLENQETESGVQVSQDINQSSIS